MNRYLRSKIDFSVLFSKGKKEIEARTRSMAYDELALIHVGLCCLCLAIHISSKYI